MTERAFELALSKDKNLYTTSKVGLLRSYDSSSASLEI